MRLGGLACERAGQPHRGPGPVDLHHLPGLVLQVVGDPAGGDVVGVAAAEGRVALAQKPFLGGPVAQLLVEQPHGHARALELGVHVAVVGLDERFFRLGRFREQ